jgi:hypothetical protein
MKKSHEILRLSLYKYLKRNGYKVHFDVQLKGTNIDVTAVKDNFFGFEVEDNFNAFSSGHAWQQLKNAKDSQMLDYFSFVVPHEISDHVLSSYGHILDEYGAGLLCLNEEFHSLKQPKKWERIFTPSFSLTETDLSIRLIEFFESKGFELVDKDCTLPQPLGEIKKKGQPRIQWIDLCFLPKGKTIHDAVDGKEVEHIGVEIKVNEQNWEEIEEQLIRYRCSGCLSRLYLALPQHLYIKFKDKIMNSTAEFGVIVLKEEEIKIERESPKFTVKFDSIGCYNKISQRDYHRYFHPSSIWIVGHSDKLKQAGEYAFKRMLLLPLGKSSYRGAENVIVKVSPGPVYEWDAHLKECLLQEICKEEIEQYEKFLNIKKSKESKSKGKKYYITEEQRELLKKKDFEAVLDTIIYLLRKNKILPYNLSRDKVNELRDRAIKGSPLTKKEKEKIEILLECYNLWSSSENWDVFWNKFLIYVEKKKKS